MCVGRGGYVGGGGGLCPGLRELRNKVEEEGEGGR